MIISYEDQNFLNKSVTQLGFWKNFIIWIYASTFLDLFNQVQKNSNKETNFNLQCQIGTTKLEFMNSDISEKFKNCGHTNTNIRERAFSAALLNHCGSSVHSSGGGTSLYYSLHGGYTQNLLENWDG